MCLFCCGVQVIFYHEFFQITHCTNMKYFYIIKFLLVKNIIATKMKENG